jgi:DNA ligase-1
MIFWKPLLAATCDDVNLINYPVLVSRKLDGIRCTVQNGKLYSRSLKLLPNQFAQELYAGLPNGLDGEILLGDPCAEDAYRSTTSLIMSDSKSLDFFPGKKISYHVFDMYGEEGFETRLRKASAAVKGRAGVEVVQHVTVQNAEELSELEAAWLAEGNEGLMVRSINGRFKEGRSTIKEGILLKVKRFSDAESRIVGVFEEMENTNEAKTNALGRTERSTEKAGKVGKGTLGGFSVVGVGGTYDGVEFSIGCGFTKQQREDLWAARKSLIGKLVVFKYFPTGSDERPRFPVWKGFRDRRNV